MNRRDAEILRRIQGYCDEVVRTHQFFHDDSSLFHDREKGFVYRNSVTMPILQIGELAKRLSEEFRSEHREIPWKSIMGMRDVFAHHYGAVSFPAVWETSHGGITDLLDFLRQILCAEHHEDDNSLK